MIYPSKIHAITIAKNGGPEVIEKTENSFPKVEPGHIVIKVTRSSSTSPATTDQRCKVEYVGVNFIDTYYRQDRLPLQLWLSLTGYAERVSIQFLISPMSLAKRQLG